MAKGVAIDDNDRDSGMASTVQRMLAASVTGEVGGHEVA
jgi:hypothetical protein